MSLGWEKVDQVLRKSLFKNRGNYEKLIAEFLEIFSYSFVRDNYDQRLGDAGAYAAGVLGSRYEARAGGLGDSFQRLDRFGVSSYADLLVRISSRDKCLGLLNAAGLSPRAFLDVLHFMYYWFLPKKHYLKQLVDPSDLTMVEYVDRLRDFSIRFSWDMLEQGRTREGRRQLSERIGITLEAVMDLVNRADLSRLPFTSGRTVGNYVGGGYGTLEKLAGVDDEVFSKDMRAYFVAIGKKLTDFPVEGILRCARLLPKIVEY